MLPPPKGKLLRLHLLVSAVLHISSALMNRDLADLVANVNRIKRSVAESDMHYALRVVRKINQRNSVSVAALCQLVAVLLVPDCELAMSLKRFLGGMNVEETSPTDLSQQDTDVVPEVRAYIQLLIVVTLLSDGRTEEVGVVGSLDGLF